MINGEASLLRSPALMMPEIWARDGVDGWKPPGRFRG
jgi:hypothetical protein